MVANDGITASDHQPVFVDIDAGTEWMETVTFKVYATLQLPLRKIISSYARGKTEVGKYKYIYPDRRKPDI